MHTRLRSSAKKNPINSEEPKGYGNENLPKVHKTRSNNGNIKGLNQEESKALSIIDENLYKDQKSKSKNRITKKITSHLFEPDEGSKVDQVENHSKVLNSRTKPRNMKLTLNQVESKEQLLSIEQQNEKLPKKSKSKNHKEELTSQKVEPDGLSEHQLESIGNSQVERFESIPKSKNRIKDRMSNKKESKGVSVLDENLPKDKKSKSKNNNQKLADQEPAGQSEHETKSDEKLSKVCKPNAKDRNIKNCMKKELNLHLIKLGEDSKVVKDGNLPKMRKPRTKYSRTKGDLISPLRELNRQS